MSPVSAEHVRALIVSEIADSLALYAQMPETLNDDFDLRASGMIDSLGFLELVAALEAQVGFELDFDTMAPEHLTMLGPLSRHVAAQSLLRAGVVSESIPMVKTA